MGWDIKTRTSKTGNQLKRERSYYIPHSLVQAAQFNLEIIVVIFDSIPWAKL